MKKSELKEMIKSAFSEEFEGEDFEKSSREVEYGINPDMDDPAYWAMLSTDPEELYGEEEIEEAKKDTEIEDIELDSEEDITLDEPSKDSEASSIPTSGGMGGKEKKLQNSLESALETAKSMGDEKLVNQIGNTITFFTRTHVVGDMTGTEDMEMNESISRFKKLAGIIK
jgi:hypothetical protein